MLFVSSEVCKISGGKSF